MYNLNALFLQHHEKYKQSASEKCGAASERGGGNICEREKEHSSSVTDKLN